MNELQIFNSPEFGAVRTVTIDHEPWFVGKDVAEALGYRDTSDALGKHVDEEDKGVGDLPTPEAHRKLSQSMSPASTLSSSEVSLSRRASSRSGFARMYCRRSAKQERILCRSFASLRTSVCCSTA